MNCTQARELLSAQLDGALDDAEAMAVREHLDVCEACCEHREGLSAVVKLVREIPAPRVPSGFAAEVVSRLPGPKRVPTALRWLAPLAVAACVLLLAKVWFRTEETPALFDVADTKTTAAEPGLVMPRAVRGAYEEEAGEDAGAEFGMDAESTPADRPVRDGYLEGVPPPAKESAPSPVVGAPGAPDPGMRPSDVSKREKAADLPPATGTPPVAAEPSPDPAAGPGRGAWGTDRSYAIKGAEPDRVAGVILAELRRRRTLESKSEDPAGERVVQDRSGDVSGLLLYLTEREFDFVTCLLEERPGVRMDRLNGHPKAKVTAGKSRSGRKDSSADRGEDDGEAGDRRRVELRFR